VLSIGHSFFSCASPLSFLVYIIPPRFITQTGLPKPSGRAGRDGILSTRSVGVTANERRAILGNCAGRKKILRPGFEEFCAVSVQPAGPCFLRGHGSVFSFSVILVHSALQGRGARRFETSREKSTLVPPCILF
jgi:hypothetical protein